MAMHEHPTRLRVLFTIWVAVQVITALVALAAAR